MCYEILKAEGLPGGDLHRALYLQRSVCKPRNQHEIVLWVLKHTQKRVGTPWLGRRNTGRDDSSFHSFVIFYGILWC